MHVLFMLLLFADIFSNGSQIHILKIKEFKVSDNFIDKNFSLDFYCKSNSLFNKDNYIRLNLAPNFSYSESIYSLNMDASFCKGILFLRLIYENRSDLFIKKYYEDVYVNRKDSKSEGDYRGFYTINIEPDVYLKFEIYFN